MRGRQSSDMACLKDLYSSQPHRSYDNGSNIFAKQTPVTYYSFPSTPSLNNVACIKDESNHFFGRIDSLLPFPVSSSVLLVLYKPFFD